MFPTTKNPDFTSLHPGYNSWPQITPTAQKALYKKTIRAFCVVRG
jgi:hypothetical protein